jgi:2-succinyl-6-hydroxy-2,4-cyclohexadiene-1-carboxylate synthase
VACHGFSQTARSWGRFGELLARDHRVLALDLPGHGGSSEIDADIDEAARLVLEASDGEPFDLMGYSMGGRVALRAATLGPPGLGRLVLISATAGIADEGARAMRRARDAQLADQIEAEDDLGAFLDRWLRQPMFATLAPEAADRSSRLANTPGGLARSLRQLGTGSQAPLWGELAGLEVPVLALVGASDSRFVDTNAKMVDRLPAAALSLVCGARHACHLEQPELAAATVRAFVAS